MKINLLCILCVAFSCLTLKGQDMHFSQFTETPALVNPALTGVDGLRVSANYRNQWKSVTVPYNSYGASFEMRSPAIGKRRVGKFGSKTVDRDGRFAAGISVYKDKMGDGNFNLTQANLSISSFVPTGENSHLSVGVQGSFNQRSMDESKFVFPNQYGGTGYDPNLSSGEKYATSQNYTYMDLGAGVLWSFSDEEKRVEDHKKVKARFGFSAYHLLQPKQKYLANGGVPLARKLMANGDFLISIQNTRVAIAPAYIVSLQGQSREILVGALLKYYTRNDTKYTGFVKRTSLGIGAYYRNQDAAIAYMLIEINGQYAIGVSYDITLSALSQASNSRGGMELSLRYNVANTFLYQKMK